MMDAIEGSLLGDGLCGMDADEIEAELFSMIHKSQDSSLLPL